MCVCECVCVCVHIYLSKQNLFKIIYSLSVTIYLVFCFINLSFNYFFLSFCILISFYSVKILNS